MSVHLSPGQLMEIERARGGDKEAFARLYLLSGTILAAGWQLPPELAAFMAERLQAIGAALRASDSRRALPDAVAPGVKPGRPAKRTEMLEAVAEAVNDLYRPGRLKKQLVIGLAEAYGLKPDSVKTATHAVKRAKRIKTRRV